MFLIKNLSVNIDKNKILKNVNIKVEPGTVHAIMGPNASGKSTLTYTIAGRQNCIITEGTILFKNINLTTLKPEERAVLGIFISFQNSVEIPGVCNQLFLYTAINSIRKARKQTPIDRFDFIDLLEDKAKMLKIPKDLLDRSINVGFSGGEKKRNDLLQISILEPDLCILDEIDSGLDIDAVKIIANGLNQLRNNKRSLILITHYQRILNYITPDYVHVLNYGTIVKSGNFSLVNKLEEYGYDWIKK